MMRNDAELAAASIAFAIAVAIGCAALATCAPRPSRAMGNFPSHPATRDVWIPLESTCVDGNGRILQPPDSERPELVVFINGVRRSFGPVVPGTCVRVEWGIAPWLRLRCSSAAGGWSVLSARAAPLPPGTGWNCNLSADLSL